MRINLLAGLLIAAPVVAFANPAQAAKFEFDSAVGGNANVGVHKQIKTSFDDESDLLTWSSTFSANPNSGKLANGAWLVLSEGPNPKGYVQEYTMFYMDGVNNKLTAYAYNGVNGSNSWADNGYGEESDFIGSWDLNVSESADGSERTFSFDLDMTDINNNNVDGVDLGDSWKGTFFGEEVGVWFHGVENVQASYDIDGSGKLTQFQYDSQGWFDAKDLATTKVPEPGAVASLAMMGLLGAKVLRRKSA